MTGGTGSLRAKLLLLSLLLVVLPGALFAWIAIGSGRAALERAVGRQLAEVAQDASERVEAEIGRVERSLAKWASQERLRALEIAPADERLSRLLVALGGDDPTLVGLCAADAHGRVIAASNPAHLGASVSSEPWWPAVMRSSGASIVASPGRSPEGSFLVAAPIFEPEDHARRVGAIFADYPWERLSGDLQHLQHDLAVIGLDVDLLIVDREARVVAGGWWETPSRLAGKDLRALGWRTPEMGQSAGRASYVREDNADSLVGFSPVASRLGLAALAVQPLSEALAPVYALRRTLLLTMAGVLLSGLVLAGLIANRLSRPIRTLTEATRELARTGEAKVPVVVSTRDEIGDLAAAFNRMANDLTRARDDLVTAAKFAFVGELAAGMTHEIRTPLGIVRSSAQILGRRLPEGDRRGTELVEMIVSEVDRLDRVVAGLLELARPREPVFEEVALETILARATSFLAGQADEQGIALHREVTPVPSVRCDPEQIYQVALNLLINAVQNVPRGGSVTVRTVSAPDVAGFEVIDDGPGIPAELLEKIFTPFFTRRPGGTGLGLALVQRIVQAHHGSISVRSEPGRGTTFRVELPTGSAAG